MIAAVIIALSSVFTEDPFPDLFPPRATSILDGIADIEILLASIFVILFTAVYMFFFKWRKTDAGKALVYFLLSLIGVLVLVALGRFIGPDYFLRDHIRFAIYSFVAIASGGMLWTLIRYLFRNTSSLYSAERSDRKLPLTGERKDTGTINIPEKEEIDKETTNGS